MTIRLSPKYGVNPSVVLCFFCQKAKDVALFGRLNGDAEAPREVVLNTEPCAECAGFMEQGVILISVDPSKTTEPSNPWRSGGWCVIRAEAIERWKKEGMNAACADALLAKRVGFIADEDWECLGLPRGPVEGVPR